MKEAEYYKRKETGNEVICGLCPHLCRIQEGKRGICGVRENKKGKLYSLVYGRLDAANLDPVEKKPLYHFLPGSSAFSVATVGCNLSCPFCQNHTLSLGCRNEVLSNSQEVSAEQVIGKALSTGAGSICFTYTEPSVYFEYMRDIALESRYRGLATAMVSNGFIQPEPLEELIPLLDAANIDLKSFREETYRKVIKGSLEPVLKAIEELHGSGVWVEITTLVVPGINDSAEELKEIARFIASVGEEIPWHVSRFHPA